MSSEKSPPTEFEELRSELLQSEARATRNRKAFWLLGSIWLLALLLLFLLNAQTLRRQEEAEKQLVATKEQIAATQADLVQTLAMLREMDKEHEARFGALERRDDELWKRRFGEMSEDSQRSYTKQVALDVLGRRERTEPEKKLLTQQTGARGALTHRDILFAEAVSAIDTNNPEEALARLDEYDAQGEPDAQSLLARGRALDLQLDMEPAIQMYSEALERNDLTDPERVAAYGYRCLTRFRLAATEGLGPQALQDAEGDCDESLALDPGYWPSYNYRGLIRYLLGKDDGALSDWNEAAGLLVEPKSRANPLENQSLVYLRQGKWEAALETTREVQALAGDGSSWNWLFQWIAADKLGKERFAQEARERWEESANRRDRERLLVYLPEELHGYLNSATTSSASLGTSAPEQDTSL